MRLLILSLLALFSSSSFAFIFDSHSSHTLNGSGIWKSKLGENGTYGIEVSTVKNEEGQIVVSEEILVANQKNPIKTSYIVGDLKDNFFKVYSEKTKSKIGNGYCFELLEGRNEKVCHIQFFGKNKKELTLHANLDKHVVYRMGSFKHIKKTIIWKDTLEITSFTE